MSTKLSMYCWLCLKINTNLQWCVNLEYLKRYSIQEMLIKIPRKTSGRVRESELLGKHLSARLRSGDLL